MGEFSEGINLFGRVKRGMSWVLRFEVRGRKGRGISMGKSVVV